MFEYFYLKLLNVLRVLKELLNRISDESKKKKKKYARKAKTKTTVSFPCVGPTDLSMKNTKPLLSHKLNATEMTAVRQLINGYRESAAFLLRSADELEQLLLQQP